VRLDLLILLAGDAQLAAEALDRDTRAVLDQLTPDLSRSLARRCRRAAWRCTRIAAALELNAATQEGGS